MKADLNNYYDFHIALRDTDGADSVPEAVLYSSWVFLSRWERAKLAVGLLRQCLRRN